MMRMITIIVILATCSGSPVCRGAIFDYSVAPKLKDNFIEARFRMAIPDEGNKPSAIVIFIPGTDWDGRGVVADSKFLSIARSCHAVLMGCDYRGEGLAYDDPAGGSGRALDEALSYFAAESHNDELAHLPLILVGYSQGGMLAFNYICWHPERIKAFAALKAIFPKYKPKPDSYQVPGILVAGEMDEPGRIRAIADVFADAAGHHAKWAFLYQRKAGHELDPQCIEVAGSFLRAAVAAEQSNEGVYYNAEIGNSESLDSTAVGTCWFPDEKVADLWKSSHLPMPLQKLASLPERTPLGSLVAVHVDPEKYECVPGARQTGTLDLSGQSPGVTIDGVRVDGKDFAVTGSGAGKLPLQIKLRFAPQESTWGPVRADVGIDGSLDGQKLAPIVLTLAGKIKGAVTATPSLAYLGVVPRNGTIDSNVTLKSDRSPLRISRITSPDGIKVSSESSTENTATLHIHWVAGNRLGNMRGEILIGIDSPEAGTLRVPVLGLVSQ